MTDAPSVVFESFGVTGEVAGPPGEVDAVLPPGWRPGDPERVTGRWTVDGDADRVEAAVRAHVALHAPEHVFVHAGVVALGDRALVLPGPSRAGKSTLVAALVRAGATYHSDEFAVLDRDGMVHPYAKALSLRALGTLAQVDLPVAGAAEEAARVAVIATTAYAAGARWDPARRDPSAGALALLANAVPARERPAQTLAAIGRAAAGATVLDGTRGEADEAAAALLAVVAEG
jgi:hypothetical protein